MCQVGTVSRESFELPSVLICLNSPSNRQGPSLGAESYGETGMALSGALPGGRTMEYHAEVESAIADLTSEAIVAAMRRRLDPSAMTIIKAGDFATRIKGSIYRVNYSILGSF